jgi:hypothetical protein
MEEQMDSAPLAGRFLYALAGLVCLTLVSFCLGEFACFQMRIIRVTEFPAALRTYHLNLETLARMPLIRFYLLAVYFWGICFIISVATLQFGYGVSSQRVCLASIMLCLVFYVVDKVIMYLFLIERAHVVRCRQYLRRSDRWYLFNTAIVALGFGTIAILSFIFPVAEFSTVDGKCRIGLPFKITLPLLIYDISINVYLTFHFLYFARPHIFKDRTGKLRSIFGQRRDSQGSAKDLTNENRAFRAKANVSSPKQDHLRKLAKRTLNGMCIMLLATVINLSILFHMSGQEQEWMCFMFCTLDGKDSFARACTKTILTVQCSDGWHSCLALCHQRPYRKAIRHEAARFSQGTAAHLDCTIANWSQAALQCSCTGDH